MRASQRWSSTVFGFATTITPKTLRPTFSGRAAASSVWLLFGGRNWKRTTLR